MRRSKRWYLCENEGLCLLLLLFCCVVACNETTQGSCKRLASSSSWNSNTSHFCLFNQFFMLLGGPPFCLRNFCPMLFRPLPSMCTRAGQVLALPFLGDTLFLFLFLFYFVSGFISLLIDLMSSRFLVPLLLPDIWLFIPYLSCFQISEFELNTNELVFHFNFSSTRLFCIKQ